MLSLLIPTYCFDCLSLIQGLHGQCEALCGADEQFSYEIVVVDDATPDTELVAHLSEGIRSLNQGCVRFIQLKENAGHAVVRNRLLREARGKWVLMVDSDAEIIRTDFVAQYWRNRYRASILIGGIVHPKEVKRGYELRSAYEESVAYMREVNWRNKHPYAVFSVFNLMALKTAVTPYGFDERCEEYGYEDYLLGVSLERDGVSVLHIDNPLLHTGIDPSEVFLRKTETAMRTLCKLPADLRYTIGIAKWAHRLSYVGGTFIFNLLFRPWASRVRSHLLGTHPSMFLFQLYKLHYYLNMQTEC
jgi:glycosyltransferase involved in cell wall biosynthesis